MLWVRNKICPTTYIKNNLVFLPRLQLQQTGQTCVQPFRPTINLSSINGSFFFSTTTSTAMPLPGGLTITRRKRIHCTPLNTNTSRYGAADDFFFSASSFTLTHFWPLLVFESDYFNGEKNSSFKGSSKCDNTL